MSSAKDLKMPSGRDGASHLFGKLKRRPPDPLLSLIAQFRNDAREGKVDLGVGVYRNADGVTPVMRCIKDAERLLLAQQTSKSYLGAEGDRRFVELLKPLACGESFARDDRLIGIQTPGGTGALRLAAEVINAAVPHAKIWIGTPSWPNHEPIFSRAGLKLKTYPSFDIASQRVLFDDTITALKAAEAGDVVLLHGCCHNPTGADYDPAQWIALAKLISARGLVPLIDLAYQGLGRGFDADRQGAEIVLEHVGEALVAYSCDKNFGLYRERTGALFAFGRDTGEAQVILSNILAAARASWSMPPDHGAAAVRLVLESGELTRAWRKELDEMRLRLVSVRQELAAADPVFEPLLLQHGMFSLVPLDPASIVRLRTDFGIYIAPLGRINVAGIQRGDIERLTHALHSIQKKAS